MSTSYTVPCKVLDKRKKDRWLFGPAYYLTLRCLTSDEDPTSPIVSAERLVHEYKVNADRYYEAEIGTLGTVVLYQWADRRTYPYPEDDSP